GYSFCVIDNAAFAWDNVKFLLTSSEFYSGQKNLPELVDKLMKLTAKESVLANASFNEFYEKKRDVSLWLSSSMFEGDRDIRSLARILDIDLTDSYVAFFVNFDKDKVSLLARFMPNEKLAKELDKFNSNRKFNSKLLTVFPKETYAVLSVTFDPEAIYERAKTNHYFKDAEQDIKSDLGVSLKEIFAGFGGSLLVSISGFEQEYYGIKPNINVAFDITNEEIFKKIITELPFTDIVDGFYRLDGNIFLTHNKETVLISSMEGVKAFTEGGFKENLSDNAVKSKIADYPAYFFINLNYSDYPQNVKDVIDDELRYETTVRKLLHGLAKNLEVNCINNTSAEVVIQIKENHENSLQALIRVIDEIITEEL
ncbi:MAG: DUF4836 family protein, partial [Bacteroidales bacterium]|nr:DUF4836 family protein [Bacteroidales bacterium]